MVVLARLSHKFGDSGKMLFFNLSVPEILQPECGIRTISSLVSVRSWSALPERHCPSTAGQNLLQRVDFAVLREDTCPAPAFCTSLIPSWGRTKPADSYTKRPRQGWLLESSPTSSVNTMAVTASHHGRPGQRAPSSVTPAKEISLPPQ